MRRGEAQAKVLALWGNECSYERCRYQTACSCILVKSGLSLKGGGRGFPPATMNVALPPGYFQWKKNVVFIWQLEILVTILLVNVF